MRSLCAGYTASQLSLLDQPPAAPHFDGKTYDPQQDATRLRSQLQAVRAIMSDGEWHTLPEIARKVRGWIIDYRDVNCAWAAVKDRLDHRSLNEVPGLENPTCELIAAWIWDRLKPELSGLSRIELRETERCGVVYEG